MPDALQLPLHEQDSAVSSSIPIEKASDTMHSRVNIHKEPHKSHGDLIRDSIIGFSDGITVPFALTAGLSSLGDTKIVILGGIAELFAGSISMGLGAFLASITDNKHYDQEEQRERREVKENPTEEEAEIYEIFEKYGVQRHEARGVVEGLKVNEQQWVQVCRKVLKTSNWR
jgi:vacuolar iron transporter family protein